jgi:hypothetical protein
MFDFLKKLFMKNPEYGTGALINPIDLRDIPVSAFQEREDIPSKYITDISMLDVNNQYSTGSCTAQAISKMIEYYEKTQPGKESDLSARFLYGMSKLIDGYEGDGTYPRIPAKIVNKTGIASNLLLDSNAQGFSDIEYRKITLTGEMLADAMKRTVEGYAFVNRDVESLKQANYKNKVMAITLRVGDWKEPEDVKPLYSNGKLGNFSHYVMIYGYEDIENDTIFYFLNSWGEKWGEKGCGKFYYSEFQNNIWDALVLTKIPEKIIENVKKQDYVFISLMKIGMRSEEIKELQKRLGITPADGIFGPKTKGAVIEFQRQNGLYVDGIVGAKTRSLLNKVEDPLIEAIIQVESGGYLNAIGDNHLEDKAFGPIQIRRKYIEDVNKANGTSYKAEDMLGNKELSIWAFKEYMKLYGHKTNEDMAKAHNGGGGWKKLYGKSGYEKYTQNLDTYWGKVQRELGR